MLSVSPQCRNADEGAQIVHAVKVVMRRAAVTNSFAISAKSGAVTRGTQQQGVHDVIDDWAEDERVSRFLRGLSRPRVANALRPFGFSQTDWDEGWQLLRDASGTAQLAALVLHTAARPPTHQAWI